MIDKFMEGKYNLERNPFTGYGSVREDLRFWVNREEEIGIWKKTIEESLKNPTHHYISFIIGDYGMGKSLSIYKIEEICGDYKNVFQITFALLGEEKTKKPGLDFIQRIFKFVNFNRIKVTEQQVEKLNVISKEVSNIYHKIFFSDEETKTMAFYFLSGQLTPTQSQMKKLGIIRKINDIEIAKEYFKGFLYLLKIAGYSTLALLIDEFEYLFSLVSTPAQRDIYFALLRGLYDLPTKINDEDTVNMLFFLVVSNEEYRRLELSKETEEAKKVEGPVIPFMRRVYTAKELTPLGKDLVEDLIELRLKYNSVKNRFEKDALIPYTKDFVDFIWKETAGHPGDIIFKCGHILDVGLKYRVTELNKNFALKALRERGIGIRYVEGET